MPKAEVGTVYVRIKADLKPLVEQLRQLRDVADELLDQLIERLEDTDGRS